MLKSFAMAKACQKVSCNNIQSPWLVVAAFSFQQQFYTSHPFRSISLKFVKNKELFLQHLSDFHRIYSPLNFRFHSFSGWIKSPRRRYTNIRLRRVFLQNCFRKHSERGVQSTYTSSFGRLVFWQIDFCLVRMMIKPDQSCKGILWWAQKSRSQSSLGLNVWKVSPLIPSFICLVYITSIAKLLNFILNTFSLHILAEPWLRYNNALLLWLILWHKISQQRTG